MAAIAATTYATTSSGTWSAGVQVAQARREADQAEARARDLRSQADAAENESQASANNVQRLEGNLRNQSLLSSKKAQAPVINTQGQATGRVLNVIA